MVEYYHVEVDGGDTFWYKIVNHTRVLHRTDGPAIMYADGKRVWFRDALVHRDDGPAVEWPNGFRAWYQEDNRHREDGPAVIKADGTEEYWLYDDQYSFQEWQDECARVVARRQSAVEMTVAEIEAALGKRIKIVS